ncbi:MAG: hypothetical protein ACREC8_07585 [Limisphaerales bacterium]
MASMGNENAAGTQEEKQLIWWSFQGQINCGVPRGTRAQTAT